MSDIGRAAVATALLLLLAPPAPGAEGDELSRWQARRLLKDARTALAAGSSGSAAELYQRVVDGTQPGDERRGEALYGLAVSRLEDASMEAVDDARQALSELLGTQPEHERAVEARALRTLLEALAAVRSRATEGEAALAAREAAWQRERETLTAEAQGRIAAAAAESGDLAAELEEAQARLAAAQAELEATRRELTAKEEALRRIKETVVGERPGG